MSLIFFQVRWAGFLFCSFAGTDLQAVDIKHILAQICASCSGERRGRGGMAFLLWAMLEVVIEEVNSKVL